MEQTEVEIPVEELLAERKPRPWGKWLGMGFWIVIGIVFPIVALAVEAAIGVCQSSFVDPIPTVWHAMLIALVPLSNFLTLWLTRSGRPGPLPALILLNGAATAISAVYAVVFIPLLPFAAMYTMMTFWAMFLPAVLTLLPCAPLASLIADIRFSRLLAKQARAWNIPARNLSLAGAALALAAVVTVEGPRAVSRIALDRLSKDGRDIQALQLARRFGDAEILRAAAYGVPMRDFLGWMTSFATSEGRWMNIDRLESNRNSYDPDSARRIYFQVTGEGFNSRSLPSYRVPWLSFLGTGGADLGGNAVGALTEDVTLTQSAIDGSVSADTLTSYTEWTMTFHNANQFRQHEARAEILLPEGGVVSRVTLWIAGEPVEALYGTRGQATEAYQRIVRASRDPLLVTTSGPDRVLVQCFPIEPQKDMKIRIGITAPLKLENRVTGAFTMPRIIDRNFLLRPELSHQLWVESKTEIRARAAMLKAEHPEETVYGLRGSVQNSETGLRIEVPIGGEHRQVQSFDAGASQIIGQQLVEYGLPQAGAAVLVIDGSAAMSDSVPGLVQTIAAVPAGTLLGVIVAGDEPIMLTDGFVRAEPGALENAADAVRGFEFTGGRNNAAALTAAWDLAAAQPGTRIIWIHGTSPAKFDGIAELEQRQQRRPNGPVIFSLETEKGPNRTLEQVDLLGMLADFNGVDESLVRRVSQILAGGTTLGVAYSVRTAGEAEKSTPAFQHVNRLWAATSVREMVRQSRRAGKNAAYPKEATDLALRFRLVTPATGAVVLAKNEVVGSELQPATPGMVPSVPEPEMYALAAVLLAMLAFQARRKRHANLVC